MILVDSKNWKIWLDIVVALVVVSVTILVASSTGELVASVSKIVDVQLGGWVESVCIGVSRLCTDAISLNH